MSRDNYLIEAPIELVQYIRIWNHERAALEIDNPPAPYGMKEANRDSAVDLLHSIAMQIDPPGRDEDEK